MLPNRLLQLKETIETRTAGERGAADNELLHELTALHDHPAMEHILHSAALMPGRVGPPPDHCPCCGK